MNDNLIPLAEEWLANPHNLEPAFRAGQAAPIIDGLLAEVKQLEGEVFAWRMRNHKLADEVKRLQLTVLDLERQMRGGA